MLDGDPWQLTEKGTVHLCDFCHISTSGYCVRASLGSFITVFWRPLQVAIRPMLQDHSPVCPGSNDCVLWPRLDGSRCYCAEAGIGPGDILLDGDPAPRRKGAQQPPLFGHVCVAKRSPISATGELLSVRLTQAVGN